MDLSRTIQHPAKATALWVAFSALFYLIYNASLPLHYDEAYYWWMSKHPALSYFDIPTALPYFIKAATLFSDENWAIRLVSLFCISGASLFLYRLTSEIYTPTVAFWTVLTSLSLPFVNIGYSITTTDMPFILFWTAGIYFAHRALSTGKTLDYLVFGLLLGLGFMSKYSTTLLGVGVFLFALIWRRDALLTPKILITGLAFLLAASPTLIWNYQHEWASLLFRYAYGSPESQGIRWSAVGEFWGVLALLFTPVFFVYFVIKLFSKTPKSESEKFLLFIGLFFLAFFFYKAFSKAMAPNWISPGVYILLPFIISRLIQKNHKKTLITGLAVAILMTSLIKFPGAIGLPAKMNINSKLMGYEEMMREIAAQIPEGSIVAGSDYGVASLFKYYTRDKNYIVIEPFTERVSDIDYWYDYGEFEGKDLYFIDDQGKGLHQAQAQCQSLKVLGEYRFNDSRYFEKRNYYLYDCKKSIFQDK
jgi:4-amino-4-deoxy-L-arabinose transferase-like glycosyltransferase